MGVGDKRLGYFTHVNNPVSTVEEAGLIPEPVWTGAKNLAPIPGPSSLYRVATPTDLSRPMKMQSLSFISQATFIKVECTVTA